MKPLLGVTLTNTWTIKNIVFPGILRKLQAHFRLLIWVPPQFVKIKNEQGHRKFFGRENIVWMPLKDINPSRLCTCAKRIAKAALFARHDISTENIYMQSSRKKRTRAQRFIYRVLKIRSLHSINTATYWFGSYLRIKACPSNLYSKELKQLHPDVVLMTQPMDPSEDPLYCDLKKLQIPVLGMIHSWDNVTAKGILHEEYDLIMTWNHVLARELLKLYPSYEANQVVSVGAPRFDVHKTNLLSSHKRESFFKSLGLDPSKKLLLFANSVTSLFSEQPTVIRDILNAMRDGELPGDLQLLIRCHPQDPSADYAQFENNPRVTLWRHSAQVTNFLVTFPNPIADLDLSAAIRHSVACVNAASTVALESVLCDTPTISVAYDGDRCLSYHDSIISAYDFEHQKPFMAIGATDLCKNKQELVTAINDAITNPDKRKPQRKKVKYELLGGDDLAADKIVSVLTQYAATELKTFSKNG